MDREHEYCNRVLQAEEQAQKKQKLHTSGSPEGVDVERSSTKRSQEQPEEGEKKSRKMSTAAGASVETEPRAAIDNTIEDTEMDPAVEHVDNKELETKLMERMLQDDMKWTLNHVEDMCEGENQELLRVVADISYENEKTWEELDPKQVQKGEREEHERFCKMGVCDYASRDTAIHDINGKFVKVKWFEPGKGAVSDAVSWRKNLGTESGLMNSSRERCLWVQSVWPWSTQWSTRTAKSWSWT